LTYEPEIAYEFADEQHITVMLKSRSIAQLDRADFLIDQYDVVLESLLFWFARIKAIHEGRGDGTLMMRRVCYHLDKMKATAINEINPYGKRDLEELIGFFALFGFQQIGEARIMRRSQ